jgi:formimidoylglutamate deiminase
MSSDLPIHPDRALFAAHALLPEGWADDVLLAWNSDGVLSEVRRGARRPEGIAQAAGPVVPGMPNLHSHAFQRVFAGLTEQRGDAANSFWGWREQMYRVALAVSPVQLEDIATQLYIEMLKAGYTSVCEFHYLHHDAAGKPYANPAEMSLRLMHAARLAGIGLTLLPVLYQHSSFGAAPPRPEQRRFLNSVDGLLDIVQRTRGQGARIGIAPHSLRAVAPDALRAALSSLQWLDATAPIHIHIAEQEQEVNDCIAWSGQRPVQWLMGNAPVDARWCLVHATHIDAGEARAIVASGATLGLCPSTEANLGDGIVDAAGCLADGAAWGIGSDSHASLCAVEELRLLEYTQRLAQRQRNVLASPLHEEVADALWLGAVAGGARASGRAIAGLIEGQKADFVVLRADHALAGLSAPQTLASHVFASHGGKAVRDVWVAGVCRVSDGHHEYEGAACEAFVKAREQLLARA